MQFRSIYRTYRQAIRLSVLSPAERHVLLELVEYLPHCWPAVATIASHTGYSDRQVRRVLRLLEDRRILIATPRPGNTTEYVFRSESELSDIMCTPDIMSALGEVTPDIMSPTPDMVSAPTPDTMSAEADPDQADLKRGVPARAYVYDLPEGAPPPMYLTQCQMAGVSAVCAQDTWDYWQKTGLPPGGVKDLHGWLVMKAKKRGNGAPKSGPTAAPKRAKTAAEALGGKW